MIIWNKYFITSATLVVLQQFLIATSTYFIAKAGYALSTQQPNTLLFYVVLFFITALAAYFLSSCATYFQMALRNNLWKNYVTGSLNQVKSDMSLASSKNKQNTVHWLTGEALSTLEDVSIFSIDCISTYCNIIFTLIVFAITLGYFLTGAIATAIVLSVLLTHFWRRKIETLANTIQNTKLQAFTIITRLWDTSLFANKAFLENAHKDFDCRTKSFFDQSIKYTVTEQIIACLPIYFAVPLIIASMYYLNAHDQLILGSVVAVLPRSLQLLGNIHGLSLCNSRILLMRYKLNNLKQFTSTLEHQNLDSQINRRYIQVFDCFKNAPISIDEFLESLSEHRIDKGRFLITGPNGMGKTSLLKSIKSLYDNAILISPEIYLLDEENLNSSSGEKQIQHIKTILETSTNVLLLDEWDAHLDKINRSIMTEKIDTIAKNILVIEVRHY